MAATTGLGFFSQWRLLALFAERLLSLAKRMNRRSVVGMYVGNFLQDRGLAPTANVLIFTQYCALLKARRAIDSK
jgi:hypothetical protein